ncbi:uncharacterized protein LOC112875079 isoform X3 [Panicum hallii]|uniref:uncharacterized protein LOC112875079 isoform X3 n=1 Tax=Panicum hallii TaxID=206008 RepID=UPI000DF4D2B4|nr:uncharacterized protein LOC112875079 isoform X3 [Panicum hallii]
MTSLEERDSACWDQVFESIDLLYAKVGEMDTTQQRMSTQMDLGNQVMEQILKDQQTLAQQMEATRQAIARFSQNVPSQPDPHHHQRPVVDPPPHRRTPPPVSAGEHFVWLDLSPVTCEKRLWAIRESGSYDYRSH